MTQVAKISADGLFQRCLKLDDPGVPDRTADALLDVGRGLPEAASDGAPVSPPGSDFVKAVTIDGPGASGKSTVGKKIADLLGFVFVDTGEMYRAVTWVALRDGVPIDDEAAITALSEQIEIDVRPASHQDGRLHDVLAAGRDVTWDIRRPEVDATVSIVAAYLGVRRSLTQAQRRIGLRGGVVMVGRDIGTVVLPEAGLKIYLDASAEVRAFRRWQELAGRGEAAQMEDVLGAIRRRDGIDSTRAIAPLRPAEDAVNINCDDLDAEQVANFVMELALERLSLPPKHINREVQE